ncbi:MAG: 2-C-methyl-D-erythritol 2,4-cyclodiphosphate synthase [Gammaproteobacteria bacterium]|jgi:2-C-methyl-D-erythritol 2,4-cyclodiphosphate synthase
MSLRIGHGFDAHRIEAGEGMSLGGVLIACPWRIVAHSDGDVLIHALCDALLGALGQGDIGKWFPDSDARFSGISSRLLLQQVWARAHGQGFELINADLTLVAEVPRVAAHIPAMRSVLAAELGATPEQVNVKATTNEQMGHIGRREGIAAHAVVLLRRRDAGIPLG